MCDEKMISGDRIGGMRLVAASVKQDSESIVAVFNEAVAGDDPVRGLQDLALGASRIAATVLVDRVGRDEAERLLLQNLAWYLDGRFGDEAAQ